MYSVLVISASSRSRKYVCTALSSDDEPPVLVQALPHPEPLAWDEVCARLGANETSRATKTASPLDLDKAIDEVERFRAELAEDGWLPTEHPMVFSKDAARPAKEQGGARTASDSNPETPRRKRHKHRKSDQRRQDRHEVSFAAGPSVGPPPPHVTRLFSDICAEHYPETPAIPSAEALWDLQEHLTEHARLIGVVLDKVNETLRSDPRNYPKNL